ncbi:hypothetical protein BX600DRAFT_444917 [Xylariales sp. PMI_506]|nr:hypothetical protein BX600DRAFT_444917 [Xylariales sp. PMI_506]
MASQVCSRCRKRKIRCDLQLPSCKNCQVADVECVFWDDSLRQEIPCSYLHSLRQKVASLQLEVQEAKARNSAGLGDPLKDDVGSAQLAEQGYHLSNVTPGDPASASRMTYLGPGNSAQFLQRLIKVSIDWHMAKGIQIPKRLLPDDPYRKIDTNTSKESQSYHTLDDRGKIDLHNAVPLSTQRAIIKHYLKTVPPEYNLLPSEWQSSLQLLENPLKWSSANKDEPDAYSITIIFAISTALICRDLDSNLSSVANRCREELVRTITREDAPAGDMLEFKKWMCRGLCALALCELIRPISGQLWDLLGRALSTMKVLYEGYQLRGLSLDRSYRQLERQLFKLDMLTALHFRRPVQLHKSQLNIALSNTIDPDISSDELGIVQCWSEIEYAFTISPRPPEQFFENLIPLSLQVDIMSSDIHLRSARLYLALHPLFTHQDVLSNMALPNQGSRLFQIIARSAHTMIDHYARLNETNKIISIWMAAERVLEAGLVWAAYLISHRNSSPMGEHCFLSMGTGLAMSAILKVSALLASFAARWKEGAAFVDAWGTFVELLWNMI